MPTLSPTGHLTVDLPPGFVHLPTDPSGLDRIRQIIDAAGEAGRDYGNPDQVASGIAEWVNFLGSMNVQVFGKFAVATDSGPATANLMMSVQKIEVADPERAAEDRSLLAGAVMEIFRRRNPHAQTRVVELPIGPAMAGLVIGDLVVPAEKFGNPDEVSVPTFRAVFLIPLPTGEHLVMLDVSTGNEPGWPEISRQAVAVARSIAMDDQRQ